MRDWRTKEGGEKTRSELGLNMLLDSYFTPRMWNCPTLLQECEIVLLYTKNVKLSYSTPRMRNCPTLLHECETVLLYTKNVELPYSTPRM